MPRKTRPSSRFRRILSGRRPLITRKGKEARAATMSVRLSPRLRYLAELAARKQHRTVSKFIVWAIEKALEQVHLGDSPYITVSVEGLSLWDEVEAERLAKLALRYPFLLDHTEQVLWKLIQSIPALYKDGKLNHALLHTHWHRLIAVARGDEDRAVLRGLFPT